MIHFVLASSFFMGRMGVVSLFVENRMERLILEK